MIIEQALQGEGLAGRSRLGLLLIDPLHELVAECLHGEDLLYGLLGLWLLWILDT